MCAGVAVRAQFFALVFAIALVGCGGGGSTGGEGAPVAAASISAQEAFEREGFAFDLPNPLFSGAVTVALAGNSPSWLAISNGRLVGTPPEGARGDYQIQIDGTNGKGATSSIRFALRVGLQHERYFALVEDGFPALLSFYSEVKALWNDGARGVNSDPFIFDANGDGKLDLFLNTCRWTEARSNITGPSFCRARYFEFANGRFVDRSEQKFTSFPLNFGGNSAYFGVNGDFNRDGRTDLVFGTFREDGRPFGSQNTSQGAWAGDTWSLLSTAENKLQPLLATRFSAGTGAVRSGPVIPSLGNENVIWFQSGVATDGTLSPDPFNPYAGHALRWAGDRWQLLSGAPNMASFPILIQYDQAGNAVDGAGVEKVIIAPNGGHNAVTWTPEGFGNSFHPTGKPLGAIAVSSRAGSPFTFRELSFATEAPPVEVQKAGSPAGQTAQVWRHRNRHYVNGIFEESCSLQPAANRRLAVFRVATTLLPESYAGGPLPSEGNAPAGFYQPISLYFAYEYRNQRLAPADLSLTTDGATYQLECYDINGDGFEDISLQGFRVDGRPSLFLNNGQGRFSPLDIGRLPPLPQALRWAPKSGENHKVFVRDFNGDGINDVLSIAAVFVDPGNWRDTGLKPLLYLGRRPLTAQP
jgi:hypothetical protein